MEGRRFPGGDRVSKSDSRTAQLFNFIWSGRFVSRETVSSPFTESRGHNGAFRGKGMTGWTT